MNVGLTKRVGLTPKVLKSGLNKRGESRKAPKDSLTLILPSDLTFHVFGLGNYLKSPQSSQYSSVSVPFKKGFHFSFDKEMLLLKTKSGADSCVDVSLGDVGYLRLEQVSSDFNVRFHVCPWVFVQLQLFRDVDFCTNSKFSVRRGSILLVRAERSVLSARSQMHSRIFPFYQIYRFEDFNSRLKNYQDSKQTVKFQSLNGAELVNNDGFAQVITQAQLSSGLITSVNKVPIDEHHFNEDLYQYLLGKQKKIMEPLIRDVFLKLYLKNETENFKSGCYRSHLNKCGFSTERINDIVSGINRNTTFRDVTLHDDDPEGIDLDDLNSRLKKISMLVLSESKIEKITENVRKKVEQKLKQIDPAALAASTLVPCMDKDFASYNSKAETYLLALTFFFFYDDCMIDKDILNVDLELYYDTAAKSLASILFTISQSNNCKEDSDVKEFLNGLYYYHESEYVDPFSDLISQILTNAKDIDTEFHEKISGDIRDYLRGVHEELKSHNCDMQQQMEVKDPLKKFLNMRLYNGAVLPCFSIVFKVLGIKLDKGEKGYYNENVRNAVYQITGFNDMRSLPKEEKKGLSDANEIGVRAKISLAYDKSQCEHDVKQTSLNILAKKTWERRQLYISDAIARINIIVHESGHILNKLVEKSKGDLKSEEALLSQIKKHIKDKTILSLDAVRLIIDSKISEESPLTTLVNLIRTYHAVLYWVDGHMVWELGLSDRHGKNDIKLSRITDLLKLLDGYDESAHIDFDDDDYDKFELQRLFCDLGESLKEVSVGELKHKLSQRYDRLTKNKELVISASAKRRNSKTLSLYVQEPKD